MRQRVYTMFVTNNHASFRLWRRQNLVNHQKTKKYYDPDRLQTFLLLFITSLTAVIVKQVIFLLEFILYF